MKRVSIIVPTHNRSYSLKRLLDNLACQTYSASLMEVIIVADGCTDATLQMLQQYLPVFKLQYFEQPGLGAATARNTGAAAAGGEVLLFLDDDIEPSPGLVMAHLQAHTNLQCVVVGYLPMAMPEKASTHEINLVTWWEQKYRNMKTPGYRFGYDDLLSGNFSVSAALFNQVGKFDNSFRCREDYELGARLINAGAQFIFSEAAWGYHRDETTTQARLFKRRKDEGKADVKFAAKHPDLLQRLPLAGYGHRFSFLKKAFLFVVFNQPAVTDNIAFLFLRLLKLYEKLRLRSSWHKLGGKMHQYWYVRGLTEELNSQQALEYFFEKTQAVEGHTDLELDLVEGLVAAEELIEQYRPGSLHINYGPHFIGKVKPLPGSEKLRGAHLRQILKTNFSQTLVHALIVEQAIKKPAE